MLLPVSGFKSPFGSTLIAPVDVVVNNSAILGYLNPSPYDALRKVALESCLFKPNRITGFDCLFPSKL